jgi:asparagine synthase (glutamine-hydrolysing)
MCGIAGWISSRPLPTILDTVRDWGKTLEHRGPDDIGVLSWNGETSRLGRDSSVINESTRIALWHRRLSILDLSPTGWQPMANADGQHHIVFNGEIYNYLELRAELQRAGVTFRSSGDTEVLLEAYRAWGVDMLPRLTGMFAFAILDLQTQAVFLARDAFGIKPLYYTVLEEGFAFASEQKALRQLPISKHVRPKGLYDYLRFGVTDGGSETLLESIRQLPAGCSMRVSLQTGKASKPVSFWNVKNQAPLEISFADAKDQLQSLFLESVRLHLRSDVPVGACLSGGIDSSAIVCTMRKLEPDLELHTFSYEAEGPLSEAHFAQLVAGRVRSQHHTIQTSGQELARDLDDLILSQDEPFGSTSIYAQRQVFELARRHGIKVMLDGQGADELFGGYPPMLAARIASMVVQGRWAQAFSLLSKASRQPGNRNLWLWVGQFMVPQHLQDPLRRAVGQELVPAWLNTDWFAQRGVLFESAKYGARASHETLRAQLRQALTESSVPMLLRYEDRNSMRFGVESRVPFLTPELADFALLLPESYIIGDDGTSKHVFREAMRGIVPDEILDRKDKIGFATPERDWVKQLEPQMSAAFRSNTARTIPALRHEPLQREWNAVLEGRKAFDFRVWRWFNLIRWVELTGATFS